MSRDFRGFYSNLKNSVQKSASMTEMRSIFQKKNVVSISEALTDRIG